MIENRRSKVKENNFWSKIFGDKWFIVTMFLLFLPAAIQQLITTSVIYIDTFFIAGFAPSTISGIDITNSSFDFSQGEVAKTSVGIATTIVNFPQMIIFGVASGIGIMTAQYYGAKDKNRLQQTIIYKILVGLVLIIPFILLVMLIPEQLVSVTRNIFNPKTNTYDYFVNKLSSEYLFWSGLSFVFVLLAYSYSYTYKEIGKPKYALIAAIASVLTNIVLDPLFIIFEKDLTLAIRNIALTTMLSRFVEFIVMFSIAYIKKIDCLMIKKIKLDLATFKVTIKNSWQAIMNDSLYGFATLFLVICLLVYSEKYHDAFTTVGIIVQFAVVIFPGMASSSAVLIGNELGKGNIQQAKTNSIYLIIWGSIITLMFAIILFCLSWFINPLLSPQPNKEDISVWLENQRIAQQAEWVMMPIIFSQGIFSILYFAIKSGGSKFVFFTDGFVMIIWCILFGSLIYTGVINDRNVNPTLMFFIIEFNQIAKAIISLFIYKFTNWAKNIT